MTNEEEVILALKELKDWEGLPYCIEEPMQNEGIAVITKEALDKAIKTLEQTRWIPVEDDLPEEDELVMVTMERDGHRTTTKAIYYSGSLFWNDYVTAWMPYIEPYNAESEE